MVMSWESQAGDSYLVIGKDYYGRRFRQVHKSWIWADSVNLYNGRVYLVRDGKRELVKSVRN